MANFSSIKSFLVSLQIHSEKYNILPFNKHLHMSIYKFVFAFSFLILISCFNDPKRPEPILEQNNTESTTTEGTTITPTTPPTPPNPSPAQNAQGVWHYTCPNGHEGGAASATTCADCGATLVHNKAYHNNSNTPATQPNITTPGTVTPTPITPSSTPGQNAAGVWHYTCPNGHAGGAGSAASCPDCGATLVHNKAYHDN